MMSEDAALAARMRESGFEMFTMDAATFQKYIKDDKARWEDAITKESS